MLLFCYGTLEYVPVMRAATGREFSGEPAALDGFARYRVRAADYPGVVPEPGARTEGILFAGLDDAAIAALDRFEGPLYERRTLEVRLHDGRSAAAQVYVIREALRDTLSSEAWDKAGFARDRLDTLVRRLAVH